MTRTMTGAATSLKTATAPRLRAESVSFAYAGRDVLKAVSVQINGGFIVGVLGPNGSGKTTLLRCLLGILAPRSGQVLLDDEDIAHVDRRQFARCVAAVPQDMPTDVPLRVGELVLLGRLPHLRAGGFGFESAADLAAAERALHACGVADLAQRAIHEISGGELRRVFIARALCQQAALLLLDEPTGGLDMRHQLAILELLRQQARAGVGVLVVLHDLNLAAALCDRLILLKDGAAVASGPPKDVLTPGILDDVYGVDITVVSAPDPGGGGGPTAAHGLRTYLIPSSISRPK